MVLAPHMTLAPAAYRVEVFLFMRIPRFTVGVQPGFSAMFDGWLPTFFSLYGSPAEESVEEANLMWQARAHEAPHT